jgi:hypothetical protein
VAVAKAKPLMARRRLGLRIMIIVSAPCSGVFNVTSTSEIKCGLRLVFALYEKYQYFGVRQLIFDFFEKFRNLWNDTQNANFALTEGEAIR